MSKQNQVNSPRISEIIQELELEIVQHLNRGKLFFDFTVEGSVHQGQIQKDFVVLVKIKGKTKA